MAFSKAQYDAVAKYMESIGLSKPIHIGETGWATVSNGLYGNTGSKASDEYKEALYYKLIRDWTRKEGISCFYFEAFNEPWKDAENELGSENHFGLITADGKAKYALWDLVDQGIFEGLTRDGNPITKTYNGKITELMKDVKVGLTHRWQAGFPVNSGVYVGDLPEFRTTDLSVGYQILPTSRIDLSVQNIGDNKHQQFIGAPEMGRLMLLRVSHTF